MEARRLQYNIFKIAEGKKKKSNCQPRILSCENILQTEEGKKIKEIIFRISRAEQICVQQNFTSENVEGQAKGQRTRWACALLHKVKRAGNGKYVHKFKR